MLIYQKTIAAEDIAEPSVEPLQLGMDRLLAPEVDVDVQSE